MSGWWNNEKWLTRLVRRCRSTLGFWRLMGYDGKPTSLRHAWQIAGAFYPWDRKRLIR